MKIIKRIINFLRLKCPECKNIMKNEDCHITRHGTILDVYTCTVCRKKWI